jgi:hypothetical protein
MGFGAIAGLAGTLISTGVGAASSAGAFGGGGPNLGEYSARVNENAKALLRQFANNPAFWNIDPAQMAQQSISFGLKEAPAINAADMAQWQQMLNQAIPGYQGLVNQMTTNTGQLLQGQVPTDVQQQIQRSSAFGAIQSGIGAGGSGAALSANLSSAQSLGLTSLDLQGKGFSQAGSLLSLGKNVLSPQQVNPLSLLPLSDLINASEWSKSAQFQANQAYFNARVAAAGGQAGQTSPNMGPGIGGAVNSFFGQMGQKNPSTGYTGWQQLQNLFNPGANAGYNMPPAGGGSYGSLGFGD